MNEPAASYDPYVLPAEAIRQPPKTLWEALRQTGPGIILAGTIVGSGELILTTGIGAKHGFAFLWLILFSCVIKVFIQVELGRYAISSGKPTLGALQDVSRRRWIGNILLVWWFIMMLCTVLQLGGMTGGVGQTLNMAFPGLAIFAESTAGLVSPTAANYIKSHVEIPWAVLTCIITILFIYKGSYRRIEWLTTILVVGVTLITCVATLALFGTEFSPKIGEILTGLKWTTPPGAFADAFAVFGITGVGATELFYYPYWCLEKGYARFVGANDGSAEWEQRAKGWIRVMHLDAWVSMVVFTISTLAFYFMGAAVLHPQGLVPKGSAMIETLSQMYIGPYGQWTQRLFLIGAGAVLFKTLYLAFAANSRMTVDFMNLMGLFRIPTAEVRVRFVQCFCVIFPLVALVLYVSQRDPQFLVKLGGLAQAATLPMIATVTVYFRYAKLNGKLKPHPITDVFLWIAWFAIVVVAAYALFDAFIGFQPVK